ncbi:tetratricopeptide repeat protein [Mangrovivirga cuniculi]|uniref:Uncharacterized protein n=1 Tax=Mangrovivirga cuniculi TaxID=2715131 RepID=A0A4D7JTE7_9BACT|nr:tetratricopeptide repeat protein [Mangrovivirga cuniculi]QCK16800.1 hypothetical protein DCC35_19710 [Mangrovivirga cuniculi]
MFRFFVLSAFVFVNVFINAQVKLINGDSLIEAGIQLHDEEKYEEAISLFEQVNPGDTTYYTALIEKANSLVALEKYKESITLIKSILKKGTENKAMAFNLIGTAFDENGNADSAIFYYKKGLEEFPYHASLHYNLGVTLYHQENYEEAIKNFQEALYINPFHSNSHLYLGEIAVKRQMSTKAFLSFGTYLAINPGNNQILVILNNILLGNADEYGEIDYKLDNSAFKELDLIINSRAALKDDFKSNIKVEAPVVQQSELILEMLEYKKGTGDFWMDFYVPFYTFVQKESFLSHLFIHC